MYPIVPPPASDTGAWSVPRTLQRWLDINPVTCLTRTQAFITLPAFNIAVNWLGYSDIVASFNFEGPNNFSLIGISAIEPTNPNYMLCIMWIDENRVVHRYSLWRGVGEVIYFNLPVYSRQKIAKNFRFEIWSTNSSPAIQSTPIQVYTSVLSKSDYKWGSDFTLISSDGIETNFGATLQGTNQSGVTVSMANDNEFNGAYIITGTTTNGFIVKPAYTKIGNPPWNGVSYPYTQIFFSWSPLEWMMKNSTGVLQYRAANFAAPTADLGIWLDTGGGVPVPVVVPLLGGILPLVFPVGSYPAINVKQIYTPQPNYI